MAPEDISGILVLKAKTGRSGEAKKYDIVRAAQTDNVDDALADLPEGEYVAVNPATLKPYVVEYVTVQVNKPTA